MIYPSTTHNGGTQLMNRVEEDSIFTETLVGGPEGTIKQVLKTFYRSIIIL